MKSMVGLGLAFIAFALVGTLVYGVLEFSGVLRTDRTVSPPSAEASANRLVGIMSQQLGVTGDQARGGAGSILILAREKLTAEDFSQLSKYFLGAENLMEAANQQGAVTGPINDKAGLEAAFKNLGMGNDMVPKMSKIMNDYVGNSGGEAAKSFFASLVE